MDYDENNHMLKGYIPCPSCNEKILIYVEMWGFTSNKSQEEQCNCGCLFSWKPVINVRIDSYYDDMGEHKAGYEIGVE